MSSILDRLGKLKPRSNCARRIERADQKPAPSVFKHWSRNCYLARPTLFPTTRSAMRPTPSRKKLPGVRTLSPGEVLSDEAACLLAAQFAPRQAGSGFTTIASALTNLGSMARPENNTKESKKILKSSCKDVSHSNGDFASREGSNCYTEMAVSGLQTIESFRC